MDDEYISRKAAMEYLYRAINADPDGNCPDCIHDEHECQYDRCWTLMDFCEKIEYLGYVPAADVAPVRHGLWLTKEYMYGDPAVGVPDAWVDRRAEQSDYYAWCSLCGGDAPFTSEASLILSDWCPNCGARMDGEA